MKSCNSTVQHSPKSSHLRAKAVYLQWSNAFKWLVLQLLLTSPLTLSSTPLFTSPPWHYFVFFFFFFSWQKSSGFFPPQGLCICCFLCWRHSSSSEKDYFLTSSDLTSSVKMPSLLVKSSLIIPHKIKPPVLQHPLSSLPEFIVLHCVGHNKCVIHLFVEFCFTYRNASSRKVGTSWSVSFITVSSIRRRVISTWLTGDTIGIG